MKTKFKRYFTKDIQIIQGEIVVNTVSIVKQTPDIILLEVDMSTKRCDISYHWQGCSGSESEKWGLTLFKNDYSVYVHPTLTNFTEINFNNLNSKYWNIFAAENSKYTINICLFKN